MILQRIFRTGSIALLLCAIASSATADVFLLKSGGQIDGKWLNRDEPRSSGQEVQTPSGIRIRLPSDQLDVRIPLNDAEQQYQQIAPTYANTVEAQWQLATWCRDNHLPHRRKQHLEAILAIDTDHVGARRALGYQQIRGAWQTGEQFHRKEGYEMYRGRWRLAQDIEIQEEKSKRNLVEREWMVRLKRWRADLATERAAVAYQRFEELNDPQAVPALRALLGKESNRRVKIIYLDALLRIADGNAVNTLVATALNDADEEIFYESADRLRKLPDHVKSKPLVDSLRDPLNARVNRAAYLIGKTGDQKLVSPLIDALITVHRVQIQQPGGDTTTSFSGDGNFGMAKGGPAVADLSMQNRYVLEALVELTGQNFDFDQRAWRRWYNIEKSRIFAENASAQLRRNESSQAD